MMAEEKTENDEYSALGSDLETAWDAAESEDIEEVVEERDISVAAPEPIGDDPKPPVEEPTEEPEPIAAEETTEPVEETPEVDAPPASMSALAREKWADTPDEVRAEFRKREKDYTSGLQKNADMAKRASDMDRALSPYNQYLHMAGGQPAQTIGNLLQTASILQMGSPQQKAQTVAGLISQFGIDIPALDQMLVGETPTQQPQQQQQMQPQDVQQIVQQALQQQQQQSDMGNAQSELQTFATDAKNEFYGDVSDTMANLLDVKARNGEFMSLQDAYDMACQIVPSVKQTMDMRSATETVQKRKPAAVSITGSPSGPGGAAAPSSRHDALNDAWDSAGRA